MSCSIPYLSSWNWLMKKTLLPFNPVDDILLHNGVFDFSPRTVFQMKHLSNRLDLWKSDSMLICCNFCHPSCFNVFFEQFKLFLRESLFDYAKRKLVLVFEFQVSKFIENLVKIVFILLPPFILKDCFLELCWCRCSYSLNYISFALFNWVFFFTVTWRRVVFIFWNVS